MKSIVCIVALVFFTFYLSAQKILLKGSESLLPISYKLAEEFMKQHPETHISLMGGGSDQGIRSLMNQTADIAMSSRPLRMTEKISLSESGRSYNELIIGNEVICILVHPDNPIFKFTKEQLAAIYTGKITNWKELGGPDHQIMAIRRNSTSGTGLYFREVILSNRAFSTDLKVADSPEIMNALIGNNPYAIGFGGSTQSHGSLKSCEISVDKGKNFYSVPVTGSPLSTYPLVRTLYYYYPNNVEKKVRNFINYLKGPEAKSIIHSFGYTPR